VIRQNPSILAMTRIGPDGMILNLVNAAGINHKIKSVADERWFTHFMATPQPSTSVARDPHGNVVMLRVWPLLESSSPGSRLGGIFTAKIDIKELIADAQKDKFAPIEVLFHGTPFFSRNWDESGDYAEGSLKLDDGQELVIRYKTTVASPARETVGAMQAVPAAALRGKDTALAAKPDSAVVAQPEAAAASVVEKAPLTKKIPATPHARVASHPGSFFTDSILSAADIPRANYRTMIIVLIAAALALTCGASLLTILILRRSGKRRHRDARASFMVSPGPTSAIAVEKEHRGVPAEATYQVETESLEEITAAERETKQLPAIRELIAESSKKLRELDLETDPILRDQIFHDIQDNLAFWVSGELRLLTQRLDQLAESIRQSEKHDGKSAELQVLRYEISRIIRELDNVGKKIPAA
jgi:hypothetical protein